MFSFFYFLPFFSFSAIACEQTRVFRTGYNPNMAQMASSLGFESEWACLEQRH
ncbi:hypothetical protein ANCDUO_26585 [Ancylostoma duodenale]|uniref:Uncharacterized protein n=1 Tax=Ancylostoma duodenale TaxID=51022 RepID=A0A0C2BI33_9BILA|nr:hypothetical protein ANCDUO_26585 [Ancylostoma duodenale]